MTTVQAPKVDLYLDAAHGGWLGWADNAEKFATSVGEMGVASKLRGFTSNVANYQGLGTPCNASAFSTQVIIPPLTPFHPSTPPPLRTSLSGDVRRSSQWCAPLPPPAQLPLYCKGDGKDDACCADPCGLLSQWNSGNNEYNYVQMMTAQMEKSIAGFSPKWLIDTVRCPPAPRLHLASRWRSDLLLVVSPPTPSTVLHPPPSSSSAWQGRNGVDDMRDDCANWCNARGAGVGLLPTTNTKLPTMVDALYWLKTPGESDGCTEVIVPLRVAPLSSPLLAPLLSPLLSPLTTPRLSHLSPPPPLQELPSGDDCPRYDSMCGSADSIGSQSAEPRCPEAGAWFDYQIKQLATNAHMSGPPASPPSPVSPVSPVTPSPVTPTPAPAPTPSPAGTCANKAYAACGNGGAAGCCPSGYACTAQNQYYSQCVPTAQTLAAAAHNGLWATRHAHGTAFGIEEARKAQLLAAAAKK